MTTYSWLVPWARQYGLAAADAFQRVEEDFGEEAPGLLCQLKRLRTPTARARMHSAMEAGFLDADQWRRSLPECDLDMWLSWHWEQAPADRISDAASMPVPFLLSAHRFLSHPGVGVGALTCRLLSSLLATRGRA